MTEPEPYAEDEPEELDEQGNQLSRLTPTAREHLARAREALEHPTPRRST